MSSDPRKAPDISGTAMSGSDDGVQLTPDELLTLTPDELLTTTRTVRRRLDLARPVERGVVEACLRIAFQAPTGGNAQNWAWITVDDADTKREMAEIYRRGMADQLSSVDAPAVNMSGYDPTRMEAATIHLMETMDRVPVLLVPAFAARYPGTSNFAQACLYGSIVPAVWSFMLALRSRGLGSAWTTIHLNREAEMAELLGIPDGYTQVGLFPVAYTVGTVFRAADRAFSERRIFWNGWPAGSEA
jgi:nitroreductase